MELKKVEEKELKEEKQEQEFSEKSFSECDISDFESSDEFLDSSANVSEDLASKLKKRLENKKLPKKSKQHYKMFQQKMIQIKETRRQKLSPHKMENEKKEEAKKEETKEIETKISANAKRTVGRREEENNESMKNEKIAYNPVKSIGKISFDERSILGVGSSNGTVVYEGKYENIECAVKVLSKSVELHKKEVNNWVHLSLETEDLPPTFVRYFGTEEDGERFYLALTKCSVNLFNLFHSKLVSLQSSVSLMKDISNALAFLHSAGMVHGDVHPENVMSSLDGKRWKLSGVQRVVKWERNENNFSSGIDERGVCGWVPSEVMRGNRKTPKSDIFSLGCTFYFALTRGQHPFGQLTERKDNILQFAQPHLHRIPDSLARNLLESTLKHNSSERATIREVMGLEKHETSFLCISKNLQLFFFLSRKSFLLERR